MDKVSCEKKITMRGLPVAGKFTLRSQNQLLEYSHSYTAIFELPIENYPKGPALLWKVFGINTSSGSGRAPSTLSVSGWSAVEQHYHHQ